MRTRRHAPVTAAQVEDLLARVAGRAGRARAFEIGDEARVARVALGGPALRRFQDSCTRLLQPAAKKPPLMAGIRAGFVGAIGWTLLIELTKLSAALGRTILGKAEYLNPGGSVAIARRAGSSRISRRAGSSLARAWIVVEGTAGNTGIGLALVGIARGYRDHHRDARRPGRGEVRSAACLGTDLRVVPAVPFRKRGELLPRGAADRRGDAGRGLGQSVREHRQQCGARARPGLEIVAQTGGTLAAFVAAAGTGGTIAGVGRALKAHDAAIRVVLCDPYGSALYNYVKTGELTADRDSKRRESASSGSPRTMPPRRSTTLSGSTTVRWWRWPTGWFVKKGPFVGGSAALNARRRGALCDDASPAGSRVVTVLCDGGDCYRSRLYNHEWLAENDCVPTATLLTLTFP